MTNARLYLYDNSRNAALMVFQSRNSNVALVLWIRGPIDRIVRLLMAIKS